MGKGAGNKELYRLDNPDRHFSPLFNWAALPPSSSPPPYVALTTTNPGHTLLQAKWRAVFLFSSSTVRSAFPRYSRNSARQRGQRSVAFPQEQQPSRLPALPSACPLYPICRGGNNQRHASCFLSPTARAAPSCRNPRGSSSLPHTAPTHPQQRSGRSRPPS